MTSSSGSFSATICLEVGSVFLGIYHCLLGRLLQSSLGSATGYYLKQNGVLDLPLILLSIDVCNCRQTKSVFRI